VGVLYLLQLLRRDVGELGAARDPLALMQHVRTRVCPHFVAGRSENIRQQARGGPLPLGAHNLNHRKVLVRVVESSQQAVHSSQVEALRAALARASWHPRRLVVYETFLHR